MSHRITVTAAILLSTILFTSNTFAAGLTSNKRTVYFEEGNIGQPQKEHVIINNEGDELVLIEEVQIVGPDAGNFSTNYTQGLPRFIYPGQTPWVPIVFTPTSTEAQTATLQLVVNNGQIVNIGLNGNVEGSIVANKTTLDFDTLEEGETKTLSTILSNISRDLKIITGVEITGEGAENFSSNYTDKLPRFIYPGQEPWVNVSLNCQSSGTYTASLNMGIDNGENLIIALKGICNIPGLSEVGFVNSPREITTVLGGTTNFLLEFRSGFGPEETRIEIQDEYKKFFSLNAENYTPDTGIYEFSLTFNGLVEPTNPKTFTGIFRLENDDIVIDTAPIRFSISEEQPEVVLNTFAIPSIDRVSIDGKSEFVNDELIVYLEMSTADADEVASDLAAEFNASLVGGVSEMKTYQLRFPQNLVSQLGLIAEEINSDSNVERVTKNYTGLEKHAALPTEGDSIWVDTVASFSQILEIGNLFNETNSAKAFRDSWKEISLRDRLYLNHRVINSPEAWEFQTGSKNIRTLIVDSGFDSTHPGFTKNLEKVIWDEDDTTPDQDAHGIAVAATACADGNGGDAMVGAAWTCHLTFMQRRLKGTATLVADWISYGKISSNNNYEEIRRTIVSENSNIVNMSFGATHSSTSQAIDASWYLKRAILFLQENNRVPLFVTSAGNEGINTNLASPATLTLDPEVADNFMTIGWTNPLGLKNPKSNFGSSISLAAPGLITVFQYNGEPPIVSGGTSSAAPLVAGIASLVMAEHPEKSPAEVKKCLVNNANKYGRPVRDSRVAEPFREHNFHVLDAPSAVLCATELPDTTILRATDSTVNFEPTSVRGVREKLISFELTTAQFLDVVKHVALVGYDHFHFQKIKGSIFPNSQNMATIPILYTPKASGTHKAYLLVILKDGTKLEISISGSTAVSLTATPNKLDFGTAQIGSSRTETITLTNVGSQLADISEVGFSGGDVDDFSLTDFGSLSRLIGPGRTDTITVEFAPTQEGPRSSTFNLRVNGDELLEAPVTGIGTIDALGLRPANAEIDFGTLNIGEQSSIGMEITNDSLETIRLVSIDIEDGSTESFGTNFENTLIFSPGGSKIVFFSFAPLTEGEFTRTATLTTEGGDTIQIALTGIGMPERELSGTFEGSIAGGGIANPFGNQSTQELPTALKPNEQLIVNYTFTGTRRLGNTFEYSIRAPSAEISKRVRLIGQEVLTETIVANGFLSDPFNATTLWFNGKIGRVNYTAEWQIVDRNNPNEFGTWNAAGLSPESAVNVCDTSRLLGNSAGGSDDHYYKMRVDAGESVFISGETRGSKTNGILLDYYLLDGDTGDVLAKEENGIVRPDPSARNISWANTTGENKEVLFLFSPRSFFVTYVLEVSLPNSGCEIGPIGGALRFDTTESLLDFGNDNGKELTFNVFNKSDDTFPIELEIVGGNGEFVFAFGGGLTESNRLEPPSSTFGSIPFTVKFEPNTLGPKEAKIVISSDDNEQLEVVLKGNALNL